MVMNKLLWTQNEISNKIVVINNNLCLAFYTNQESIHSKTDPNSLTPFMTNKNNQLRLNYYNLKISNKTKYQN